MKIYDLIEMLEELSGYEEVFIEIKEQEYAGARVKTYLYDFVNIKQNNNYNSVVTDFFKEEE